MSGHGNRRAFPADGLCRNVAGTAVQVRGQMSDACPPGDIQRFPGEQGGYLECLKVEGRHDIEVTEIK